MIAPGTKLGLLGPNGSGKSTLLARVSRASTIRTPAPFARAEGLRTVMFEQGRATSRSQATLKQALCPNGDTVLYRDRRLHVTAWAKQFLFKPEQLDVLVGGLSGGEQARVRMRN